ncbi:MAG: capsule biosynthesis protein [Paracoccaceae bacterium]
MLQGPHGPFFAQAADRLRAAGAEVLRIGFNRADEVFWGRRPGYEAYRGPLPDWAAHLARRVAEERITDIVLYGDTRPVHAEAAKMARARGIRLHVFEEGYLRPYWVTYERGASNGNSALMRIDIATMRRALARPDLPQPDAPAHWGDLRQHVFYGALYHFFVLALNRAYPNFSPHRGIAVAEEFRLHLRRLLLMPFHAVERMAATRRVTGGGFAYHIVLLQLEHDASFRFHSPFASMTEFVDLCLEGFAEGAPAGHHLVFKAHPLDDGRAPVARGIRDTARRLGIADRVHFLRGGKLAPLLDPAAGAVTVNSTAGQQALWRGLPLKAFGGAVYAKPEFVSDQGLAEFFASPRPPDAAAYRDYRRFLLETSQIPGGYYSSRGRAQLLRRVVGLMLADADRYETLLERKAAVRQHLVAHQ